MSQQVSGRRRRREDEFSPGELFANGEQGAWYDPSDFATLYQDSAGTTPVTALGQPVGLMLDKANWDGRGVVNLTRETQNFGDWLAEGLTVASESELNPFGGGDVQSITEDVGGPEDRSLDDRPVSSLYSYGFYTFSVFAKLKSGSRYLQLRPRLIGNDKAFANFDLSAGTVVSGGTGGVDLVSASVEDFGNGWYRCIMVADYSSANWAAQIVISDSASERPSYTGDGTSGFYLFGAQVEVGSTATAYQPNGAGKRGLGNRAAQARAAAMP